VYYHVALEDYYNEKLICHNMPVDSWDTRPDPLPEQGRLCQIQKIQDVACP
jgi:hypothetical protein